MNYQTRYQLTRRAGVYLALVTLIAIFMHMETLATSCIAGLMTILSAYIWAQTRRPSVFPDSTVQATETNSLSNQNI